MFESKTRIHPVRSDHRDHRDGRDHLRRLTFCAAFFIAGLLIAALVAPPAGAAPALSAAALAADEQASDDENYRAARELLEEARYAEAARAFEKVAENGGEDSAAASYWHAYALHRDGRSADALRALKLLLGRGSAKAWHDDAKALVIEIQAESGRAVRPRESDADDLKLLAIQSLMHDDPAEALPILERYLDESQPAEYRKMALFVLGQSESKEAAELLAQLARGERGRQLQVGGLHFVASMGRPGSSELLLEVYRGSEDAEIKAAALQGLMVSGDVKLMKELARNERDPELRAQLYRHLGLVGGVDDLLGQYRQEKDPKVAAALLEALMVSGDEKMLMELARTEKEPKLRAAAIRGLGMAGSPEAIEAIVAIYGGEKEAKVRAAALEALLVAGDVPRLVKIARQETDPELKRTVVQYLSHVEEPEARAFMRELLEN